MLDDHQTMQIATATSFVHSRRLCRLPTLGPFAVFTHYVDSLMCGCLQTHRIWSASVFEIVSYVELFPWWITRGWDGCGSHFTYLVVA